MYDFAKDFATPLVAVVVGLVAFLQWQTARRKLRLDLFDKRIVAYNEVMDALRLAIASGAPTIEEEALYMRAADKARFLFGRTVWMRLEATWKAYCQLRYYNRLIDSALARPDAAERRQEAFSKIEACFTDLPDLVAPWLNAHD